MYSLLVRGLAGPANFLSAYIFWKKAFLLTFYFYTIAEARRKTRRYTGCENIYLYVRRFPKKKKMENQKKI